MILLLKGLKPKQNNINPKGAYKRVNRQPNMGHNYYNQAQRLKPQTHVKRDPRVETRKKQDHVLNLNCEGHALPYPSPVIAASRTHRRLRPPPPTTEIMLSADDEESLIQSHPFNEPNRIPDQRFTTGINHLQSNLRPLIYLNQGKMNRSEGKRGEMVER